MFVSFNTLAAGINSKFILFAILLLPGIFLGGCVIKSEKQEALRQAYSNASKEQLVGHLNEMAKFVSIRGKFDVGFEDLTSANIGISDKYQTADGEIIVQRPASIFLKIEAPVVKVDIAQMTSNGSNFRVAVLEDGGSGKYKTFLTGSNSADYSVLQRAVSGLEIGTDSVKKKNVNAFSNIRPQHFTDALLIRPLETTSSDHIYVQSEFYREEPQSNAGKGKDARLVNRGYYFLDELKRKGDSFVITRRFWFERTGSVPLVRQQIFNDGGELESDITYGALGSFTESAAYKMPLQIELVRPKDQYRMRLKYKAPAAVLIDKEFNTEIFTLQNRWQLPEVDLDKKLAESNQGATPAVAASPKPAAATVKAQ